MAGLLHIPGQLTQIRAQTVGSGDPILTTYCMICWCARTAHTQISAEAREPIGGDYR